MPVAWHVGKVGRSEVSVGCEVDKTWLMLESVKKQDLVQHTNINHELNDLENGDVFLPPDFDAPSSLEVVPVHDDVNHQVEGDGDP